LKSINYKTLKESVLFQIHVPRNNISSRRASSRRASSRRAIFTFKADTGQRKVSDIPRRKSKTKVFQKKREAELRTKINLNKDQRKKTMPPFALKCATVTAFKQKLNCNGPEEGNYCNRGLKYLNYIYLVMIMLCVEGVDGAWIG
jgi:hypothetical protein